MSLFKHFYLGQVWHQDQPLLKCKSLFHSMGALKALQGLRNFVFIVKYISNMWARLDTCLRLIILRPTKAVCKNRLRGKSIISHMLNNKKLKQSFPCLIFIIGCIVLVGKKRKKKEKAQSGLWTWKISAQIVKMLQC